MNTSAKADRPRMGMPNLWLLVPSSCYWAWFDSAIFRPTFFIPFSGSESLHSTHFIIAMLSGAVVLLIAAFQGKHLDRFLELRPYGILTTGCAVLGNLTVMAGAFLANPPLMCVGSFLTGTTCSLLLLKWARLYSREGAKSAGLLISAAIALGVFIDMLITGLAPLFAAFFTISLPIIAMVLQLGSSELASPPAISPQVLPLSSIFATNRHRFFGLSLSLVSAFFIFGFSFGFMQFDSAFYPTELYPFSSDALLVSRGITAFAVFAAMYFFPKRIYTVFRVGILVGIAGFIATPFLSTLGNSGIVSGFAIAVGYTTFDIITWTILSELAFVTGVGSTSTFGPGRFTVHLGIVLGFLAALAILSNPQAHELQQAFSTTVGYLLVVAEMLLLGDNSALWTLIRTNSLPRQDKSETRELDKDNPSYPISSLAQIIETYRLTEREAEVLRCLLMGRSRPRIAQMLFISENTVNSHIKHIYGKLDVHGLQDLLDRFS